jgi:hypothetical protein
MKTKLISAIILAIIIHASTFAQWSASVNLSPNSISAGQNESMGSCIGVSGSTVHVVWSDKLSSTKAVIYYIRSLDAGLTWSVPVTISDINGNAWNPAIAVNGPNVHVVWRTIVNNIRSSNYIRSLDGGNTWGQAIVLDPAVADWPAITVSGNYVYVANDILTSSSPYNTEIFFLRSTDNGTTWSAHQQITFSVGRSEDEAITAQGADVYMSWNDNRNGPMQIFYKHSADNGVTWGPDVLINSEFSYGTMVCANGTHIDVPSAGAPSGKYQIHLDQSADGGNTWGADLSLTSDPSTSYYYPYMVRDVNDLHMTYVKVGTGGQYIHSADGGATWSVPFSLGNAGITPFVAYTGCVVHIVWSNAGHIYYTRNPTGNAGHCGSCNPPAQPGTISGSATVCASSTQTYSVSAVAGATGYTWTLPSGWTGASASNSITATVGTASGVISVTANNSCGSSAARTKSISVTGAPASPGSITVSGGSPNVCPGDVRTISVVNVAGITYNWIPPTGSVIISGQGTSSISIYFNNSFTANGIIRVSASNACGTSAFAVRGIIRNLPAMPGAISGATSVCSGSVIGYSISAVSNASSYTWSAPPGAAIQSGQGTTGINVLWGATGGDISVYSTNACGNSAARTLSVSVTCREANMQAHANNQSMIIYPNPATEEINIQLSATEDKISEVLMLNTLGETVVQLQNNGDSNGKITVSLQSLPAGIYFLKVKTGNEILNGKIVRQ